MPDAHQENTIWASELVGAEVVSSKGSVARVTGLVISSSARVLALRVQPAGASPTPRPIQDEQLLLFDAALGYAPGRVRVLSADDFVVPAQVPSLFGQLAAPSVLGSPLREVTGVVVGYLWDVLLHRLSGEFIQYRICATPRPAEGRANVLTSCQLCSFLQGELTVQSGDAEFLRGLLGQVSRSA